MAPAPEKTGDLKRDLLGRAHDIKSLDVKGRLHVTDRGRKLPSFNARIWFYRQDESLFLRIRGSGPLGVTVFDLLACGNEAWIYLPSKNRILKGNTFFTSYGNIGVETAIKLMEICLNPWVPARYCRFPATMEQTGSAGSLIRLKCRFLGQNLVLRYRLDSLMPVSFESSLADITFTSTRPESLNRYPERISFHLKKEGIQGTLAVNEVKFNTLSPESPVFNRAIFAR